MALKANVISLERGYQHIDNLRAIRIISEDYNILIMDDYVPLIGEVVGSVTFVGKDGNMVDLTRIHGFYRHSKNEFSLLLEN